MTRLTKLAAPGLALLVLTGSAQAGLIVCNETGVKASVAIGYKQDGVWTSEGWWGVKPYDCTTVIGGDLSNRYYYYRATYSGGEFASQNYYFCTSSKVFTIAGDKDCKSRGYDRNRFSEADIGQAAEYTIALSTGDAPTGPAPANDHDTPDDPPGTHGEPYSIAGLLSHCDVTDSTLQCEVHADGWRYVASSAGPTRMALLEQLYALPVNTPVEISGDMIGYNGVTADVTIRDFSQSGSDPHARTRAQMQGLWQDTTDPASQVLINGGIYEEWVSGIPSGTAVMTIDDACEGSGGAGPVAVLRRYEAPDDPECYVITRADGGGLGLHMIGAMYGLEFSRAN